MKVKLKNNKIIEVTKNVAHGMIERGEAELVKGMESPKKDKMIKRSNKKVKIKSYV